MQVEILRLTSEKVTVTVSENGCPTVQSALQSPGSGAVLGAPNETLEQAAQRTYGELSTLGEVRVNGAYATLSTAIRDGDRIMFIPKIEGGVLVG